MIKEELEKEADVFVSEKADKGNFDLEQFGKAYFSESSMKQALIKFTEQRKVHTEIEINGVRFSNIGEMLQYMDKQRARIAELEAQIEKMKCCENCGWYYLQQHWRESEETNESRMFHCGTCGNKRNWKLKEIKEK